MGSLGLPLHFFKSLSREDIMREVGNGTLVKCTDYPGIKYGFYHDKIFTWAGDFVPEELERLIELEKTLF